MSDDSCCGPITILFVSIVILTVLYLILSYDILCKIGTVLTAILGIAILYELFTGGPSSDGPRPPSTSHTEHRGKKISMDDVQRILEEPKGDKKIRDEEDAEADEDLFIAYEAMND